MSVSPWRKVMRKNFYTLDSLAHFLSLNEEQRSQLAFYKNFPINIPLRLAAKMPKGTLDDPLIKQFVPLQLPAEEEEAYSLQPLDEENFQPCSRLLKKYQGRALLLTTQACAMHCRYCFRQNFPYSNEERSFEEELNYLRNDSSIHEVILSGGDPLSLSDCELDQLLTSLDAIPHLKLLRFHTRFPIGIPERIDNSFLSLLQKRRMQYWFVIHCNHPRELDEEVLASLAQVRQCGIPILCQFVLLQGINDNKETLKELLLLLVTHGIQPYYIHQLDPVIGASRFHVSIEKGLALIEELRQELPGYAIPRYVQETVGAASKLPC